MSQSPALPDVVIGGAPRAGTTFLCEVLAKHPDVFVATPYIPEPKVCLTDSPDGDRGIARRYDQFFATAPANAVKVEKTSYYLENAQARTRLLRILPDAKFVFIFREPIARAYSNWLRTRAQGLETLPFEEAVMQEGKRTSPLPPDREYARPFDYMTRGRYGTLADAWIREAGRERLAFFVFESFVADPLTHIEDLQRFMGVPVKAWSELETGKINAGEAHMPINRGLTDLLRERIAPEVRCFSQLTGCDVSVWGY